MNLCGLSHSTASVMIEAVSTVAYRLSTSIFAPAWGSMAAGI